MGGGVVRRSLRATGPITVIASSTGSGTSEYGVDAAGHLCARGYGERHGWTCAGVPRVEYRYSEWAVVCPERRDWAAIVEAGASLYGYLQDRERGLSHAVACERVIRDARAHEVAS